MVAFTSGRSTALLGEVDLEAVLDWQVAESGVDVVRCRIGEIGKQNRHTTVAEDVERCRCCHRRSVAVLSLIGRRIDRANSGAAGNDGSPGRERDDCILGVHPEPTAIPAQRGLYVLPDVDNDAAGLSIEGLIPLTDQLGVVGVRSAGSTGDMGRRIQGRPTDTAASSSCA